MKDAAQLFCVTRRSIGHQRPGYRLSSERSWHPIVSPPTHLKIALLSFQPVDPPLQFRVVDLAIILYLFQHKIEPSDLSLGFVQPLYQLIDVVNSYYGNYEWPHKIPRPIPGAG